jgi:integrase
MVQKLTNLTIDNLKPKDKPYRTYDSEVQGLHIYTSPNGNRAWTLAYSFGGKRRFHKVGTYPATGVGAARKRARQIWGQIEDGVDPGAKTEPEKPCATLDQLYDAYIEDAVRRGVKSTYQIRRFYDSNVKNQLGGREAASITPQEFADLLRGIVERGSSGTADHVRIYLKSAYKYGLTAELDPTQPRREYSYGLATNPLADIPSPRPGKNPRTRNLSVKELGWLWHEVIENASYDMAMAIRALIASGGNRVMEILYLRWDQIDFDKGTIYWSKTKTNTEFLKPMSRHLRAILEEMRDHSGHCEVVFPGNFSNGKTTLGYNSVSGVTRNMCDRYGVERFVPKDLRRTAATLLAERGLPRETIQRTLNHAINSTILDTHYNKYSYLPEIQEAMDTWDTLLDKAI